MDENLNVIKWASENLTIPYLFEIDQNIHRYTPDVYAEILDRNGTLKKYLVEIKPKKQLLEPIKPKNKNVKALLRYQKEMQEFVKNRNKWEAAKTLCRQKGWEFKIMTEEQIF